MLTMVSEIPAAERLALELEHSVLSSRVCRRQDSNTLTSTCGANA